MTRHLDSQLTERFGADTGWFRDNIPLFECPEPELEEIYYFRWKVFRQHIKSTPDGYVVTEFLPDVHWAGKHNTISVSAGLHLYEGRWLRDQRPLDDYSRFWFGGEAQPRSYSAHLADAVWARTLVTGNFDLAAELLPALVANYRAWEDERLGDNGLFWQVDDREGEEFTIAGSGYRPPINSYLYGDARAISEIAKHTGNEGLAAEFAGKATRLKTAVHRHLWDPKAQFFKNLSCDAATHAHNQAYDFGPPNLMSPGPEKLAEVREIFGLVPWTFNLPDPGFELAWRQLFDPEGFSGEFGPTTAERRHPAFMQPLQHDCLWNGPSWPFVTTQVLKGMANLLHHYRQSEVNRADYLKLLRTYAHSQHRLNDDGVVEPWIDENLHPDTGEWLTRKALLKRGAPDWDRGRDYNHSGFCDLVISGLAGLIPREDGKIEINPLVPHDVWSYWCLAGVPYQGKILTILYDRDGSRYGEGSGLRLRVGEGPFVTVPSAGPIRDPKIDHLVAGGEEHKAAPGTPSSQLRCGPHLNP